MGRTFHLHFSRILVFQQIFLEINPPLFACLHCARCRIIMTIDLTPFVFGKWKNSGPWPNWREIFDRLEWLKFLPNSPAFCLASRLVFFISHGRSIKIE